MNDPSDQQFIDSIEVLSGSPTPEELAAVKAVLSQARKLEQRALQDPSSSWSKNAAMLRDPINPGYGQWRSSFKAGL